MLESVGSRRRAALGAVAAIAAGAALTAGPAQGATTNYPSSGTFDAGDEGWVASGQSCSQLSGVTLLCDTTTSHQTTGGNPGGALATTNTVTLNVLALFQGSSVWTSPTFAIPADAQVQQATMSLDQALADSGLLSLTPSSNVTVTLVDVGTTATTDLVTTPLSTANSTYQAATVGVPTSKVEPGHSYQLRITTTTSSASLASLLGSVTTLVDNVRLAVTTPDPPSGGPNPGPNPPGTPTGPGGNGGDGGAGGTGGTDGAGGTGGTGGTVQRGPYSNSEISTLIRSLSINAASGNGPGGSLVPLEKCTIVGTPGNDRLTGTPGHDVICGLGGNDTIVGGGGRDVIDGADGNDRLNGSGGGDLLLALRGNDRAKGGSGNDGIGGGSGRDRLSGGAGKDRVHGSSGNDRVSGGKGTDRLAGGSGNDRLAARDRTRDVVSGGAGRDFAVADKARTGRKGVRGLRVADRVRGVERVR